VSSAIVIPTCLHFEFAFSPLTSFHHTQNYYQQPVEQNFYVPRILQRGCWSIGCHERNMGRSIFLFLCILGYALATNLGRNYSMVLVGGGLYDNNTAVWDTIIALGGGKGVARFGVVSAASEVSK
jgi:hypothetical protein